MIVTERNPMDEIKRLVEGRKKLLLQQGCTSLLLLPALAIASCVAKPREGDVRAELDAVRDEVAALRGDLARTSSEIAALAAHMRELGSRVADLSAAAAKETSAAARIDPAAGKGGKAGKAGKMRIEPGDLPQAVRDAAGEAVEGIEIFKAERREKKGRVSYKLRGRLGDERYELSIGAAGEIIEAEMPLEQVPRAVMDAAARAMGGVEDIWASRITDDDGRPAFDVGGEAGKDEYYLKLSPDGDILEMGMPPKKLPQAVRSAAARAVAGIKIIEVWGEKRDGEFVFDLEGRAGGEDCSVTVSAAGNVVEMDVSPEGLPRAVRRAAAKAVPGLEINGISGETREGRLVYEIEGEAGGEEYVLQVSAAGEVLEIDGPEEGEEEEEEAEAGDDDGGVGF